MSLPLITLLILCGGIVDAKSAARIVPVGRVQVKSLNEASGIVASPNHNGVYWTHNDGGEGHLYAIRNDGMVIGKIKVNEKFRDWEDIAADGKGNLYLADTGNNNRSRKRATVYRIAEPDPRATDDINVAQEFSLTFAGKPFNCESLFILNDHAYLISKVSDGQRAALYRFALTRGTKKQVLEEVLTLPIEVEVTAADISADGKRLALLSNSALFVIQIDGDVANAAQAKPTRFSIPAAQAEGCCFTPEGVLVIAESGEIFLVRPDGPTTQVTR